MKSVIMISCESKIGVLYYVLISNFFINQLSKGLLVVAFRKDMETCENNAVEA